MAKKKPEELESEPEEDLFEAFNNAQPADIQIDLGPYSVFSIRFPNELLDELCIQAERHNIKPSTYARQLIAQGLAVDANAQLVIMTEVMNNIAHQLPKTTKKRLKTKK